MNSVLSLCTQTDVTPVISGCWGQTEDVRASMDNPLNDYVHIRPQKPQNGRPRNGFIQKRGDHFDRFVTNHRPKTATPAVAGSLTGIMEMHLHAWRVSRVQNAHVWRGTAPPFAIPSHVPPKALHRGKSDSNPLDLTGRCIKSHCVSTWDRDYSYPDLGACWLSSCHTSCRILAQPLKAAHLSVRVPTGE